MHKGLTYRDAGVDIDEADRLVEKIRDLVHATYRKEVLSGIGHFGALFEIDLSRYRRPVLVSSTDGVGTKLKIAFMANRHDTVGVDLVAMCVNDILTLGAEPLFFLDYFATGRLDIKKAEEVMRGIVRGCKEAGCALVGGETAELPGFYGEGEYDLSGFVVGVVERERIIDGSRVEEGDIVVGLASSGLHSNGYSLARKVFFEIGGYSLTTVLDEIGRPLGDELLEPTRIYVRPVQRILDSGVQVKAMAHITGGGIPGNLRRVIPEGLTARIKRGSWPVPPVFSVIQTLGGIAEEEMWRTFNLGIGYTIVVAEDEQEKALSILEKEGQRGYRIGWIEKGQGGVEYEQD